MKVHLFSAPHGSDWYVLRLHTALGVPWLVLFRSAHPCSLDRSDRYALRSRARAEGKMPAPGSHPLVRNAGWWLVGEFTSDLRLLLEIRSNTRRISASPAPGNPGAMRCLVRTWNGVGRPAFAGACFDSVDRHAPTLTAPAGTVRIKNPGGPGVVFDRAEAAVAVGKPEVRNREWSRRVGDIVCAG